MNYLETKFNDGVWVLSAWWSDEWISVEGLWANEGGIDVLNGVICALKLTIWLSVAIEGNSFDFDPGVQILIVFEMSVVFCLVCHRDKVIL